MYKEIIFPQSGKLRRPGVEPVTVTQDALPALRFSSSEDTKRVSLARYSIDDTFGPEARACSGQVEGAGCGVGISVAESELTITCPAGYLGCAAMMARHVLRQLESASEQI